MTEQPKSPTFPIFLFLSLQYPFFLYRIVFVFFTEFCRMDNIDYFLGE